MWNDESVIRTGWKFMIDSRKYEVTGSGKTRSGQFYYLKDMSGVKASVPRKVLIHRLKTGTITYVN